MITILLLIIGVSCIGCKDKIYFSENYLQQGYIITNSEDTVRGNFKFNILAGHDYLVVFNSGLNQNIQVFTPYTSKSFHFEDIHLDNTLRSFYSFVYNDDLQYSDYKTKHFFEIHYVPRISLDSLGNRTRNDKKFALLTRTFLAVDYNNLPLMVTHFYLMDDEYKIYDLRYDTRGGDGAYKNFYKIIGKDKAKFIKKFRRRHKLHLNNVPDMKFIMGIVNSL